jgi:ATP diphosphatase
VDELAEVVASGDRPDQTRAEEEMGDLLFAIANLSRKLGIEPEAALRKANEKFTHRFDAMEHAIAESGRRMQDMSLEELEGEWQTVKALPRKDSHEDTPARNSTNT